MKKKLYLALIMGILSCLLSLSVGATTINIAPYKVVLNGLEYEATYEIVKQDRTLYMALDDLLALTFTTQAEVELADYAFTLNNVPIRITLDEKTAQIGTRKVKLAAAPVLINEICYVPLELLNYAKYPYTVNGTTISIECVKPYSLVAPSTSSDNYVFSTRNLLELPSHLTLFSSTEAVRTLIKEQSDTEGFIAFIDGSNRDAFNKQLDSLQKRAPYNNLSVSFREVDFYGATPTIKNFVTYPLAVSATEDALAISLGEDTYLYESLWATFSPRRSLTQVNLHKTVDNTLMHFLYEHYRNLMELRDDTFFSPLYALSSERTNTLTYQTYFEDAQQQTSNYELAVYRLQSKEAIQYVVDIFKRP